MSSKLMASRTNSASFPSPDTQPCSEGDERAIDVAKGWYSEWVPRTSYGSRKRYVAAAALMPFSSGRALPSKWDDAERWISSPVSVGNVPTSSSNKGFHQAQAQRQAKSKSGPLGPAGLGYNTYSPVLGMGVINGGMWRNSLNIESPTSVRIQLEERLAIDGGGLSEGGRRSCPGQGDPEWLDLWSGPLCPSDKGEMNSTDENIESIHNKNLRPNDGEDGLDRAVSRRDMATQMFPESGSSSPSFAMSSPISSISTNSPRPQLNENGNGVQQSPKYEVRDVQVDKQTNSVVLNFSPQMNVITNASYSTREEDIKMASSNLQREEAKIKAWENLQKAKAESAIQKLEMKLEKKRASSMEKIIDKLRRAEIKAQKMRSSISDHTDQSQSRVLLKTTSKIPSFCKKLRLSSSTRNCATCYPF